MNAHYDLLIVGGGINGVGIARDAVGRGLSVMLCERDDLAAHTSSSSTKLIHGGLRYLEYYQFGLVRKALKEREVLVKAAPHIIYPMRFIMPHCRDLRPAWLIRLGLFFYDHLSRRELLPASRGIQLRREIYGQPLKENFTKGFVYSDAWVDDARLVIINALDAAERGARIETRTALIHAQRTTDGVWRATLEKKCGTKEIVTARALVNATGPWVGKTVDQIMDDSSALTSAPIDQPPHVAKNRVRLVKGSHIIVPKIFDHDHAYIFQNDDKRIIFAIPYEAAFTLIGTTDVEISSDPAQAHISPEETNYLCQAVNRYFIKQTLPEDVVGSYSGVRPLLDEDNDSSAAAASRDYRLETDIKNGLLLLNVFGGKITTYRRLAEDALEKIALFLNCSRQQWTEKAPLPGGDMVGSFDVFKREIEQRYAALDKNLLARLTCIYGTRVSQLLGNVRTMADLGEMLSEGLYEIEARYLIEHEWAQTAEDILCRRTKLYLHANDQSWKRLRDWLANHTSNQSI